MKQQSLAFRQELFTIGTGDSHTVHEFLDEKVRFHELVQIAFSLYQTCWMPMLRHHSAKALRQPFDRLRVKLSTSLALLGVTPPGQGLRSLQGRFNGWHRWESQVVRMEMA